MNKNFIKKGLGFPEGFEINYSRGFWGKCHAIRRAKPKQQRQRQLGKQSKDSGGVIFYL